jgi:hypothetical protein
MSAEVRLAPARFQYRISKGVCHAFAPKAQITGTKTLAPARTPQLHEMNVISPFLQYVTGAIREIRSICDSKISAILHIHNSTYSQSSKKLPLLLHNPPQSSTNAPQSSTFSGRILHKIPRTLHTTPHKASNRQLETDNAPRSSRSQNCLKIQSSPLSSKSMENPTFAA